MPWVLDLDGVVWLGSEAVPGAAQAVRRLRAAGEDPVFVTNNAYARVADQEAKLAGLGIDAAGAVVTSAQAGAQLLEPGERVLVVGGPGLREEVERRGCRPGAPSRCDAVITGLDRQLSYDALRDATLAIRRGARWVLTNPDRTFPTPDGLVPGAGAIAAALRAATDAEPVVAGKPNPAMVALVRDRLGPDGVVVGDRLDTDGAFAAALGYRFGLVLTGVTGPDEVPEDPAPDHVAPDLLSLVDAALAGAADRDGDLGSLAP
jgi:4-nitrophenyl phosphatase